MRKVISISAITQVERIHAIQIVKKAIIHHQGWIANHTAFSNKAITINFEMPGNRTVDFVEALKASHINATLEVEAPAGDQDIPVMINITFLHNEPDMRQDVPAFG